MKKVYLSLAILISLLASGCASIVTKSTYPLAVSSTPDNVRFSVTDKNGFTVQTGVTPATIHLKAGSSYFRRAFYQVKFKADGYQEQTLPVYFKIDGWYFGNLLLGGWPGMLIIDPLTGAMWKIESRFLHATLDKNRADNELKILHINDLPDKLKKYLVKVN